MFKREQRSGSMIDKRFRRERTRSMVASRSMISAVDNEEGGVDPDRQRTPFPNIKHIETTRTRLARLLWRTAQGRNTTSQGSLRIEGNVTQERSISLRTKISGGMRGYKMVIGGEKGQNNLRILPLSTKKSAYFIRLCTCRGQI